MADTFFSNEGENFEFTLPQEEEVTGVDQAPGSVIQDTEEPSFDQPVEVFTEDDALGQNKISVEGADHKALKNHLAAGEDSPGLDNLTVSLLSGDDSQERQTVLGKLSLKKQQMMMSLVNSFIDSRPKDKPATPEEVNRLIQVASRDTDEMFKDPRTLFEKMEAKRLWDESMGTKEILANLSEQQQDGLQVAARDIIAKTASFRNLLEDASEKWKDAGAVSTGLNFLGVITPFVSWYNIQNGTENAPTSSILPGSNIREQIEYLYGLPHEQAAEEAKKAIEDIASRSKLDALHFAGALVGYSNWEEGVDNLVGVADLAGLGASVLNPLLRGIKGLIRLGSSSRRAIEAGDIAAMNGDISEAAKRFVSVNPNLDAKRAVFQVQGIRQSGLIDATDDLMRNTLSIFNPAQVVRGTNASTNIAAMRTNTLIHTLQNQSSELMNTFFTDPVLVRRLERGSAALDEALTDAERLVRQRLGQHNFAVVDVEPRIAENTRFGFDTVQVHLGKMDQTLFESAAQARAYADDIYEFLPGTYTIQPYKDTGRATIVFTQNIDETVYSVRDLLDVQGLPNGHWGFWHAFKGFMRGNEFIFPKDVMTGMRTATLAQSGQRKILEDMARVLNDVENKNEFNRFLTIQRDTPDPSTSNRGTFSNTLSDFSADFTREMGRAPTAKEELAYFTYRQVNDLDYVINNLTAYKNKMRLGLVNLRLDKHLPAEFANRGLEGKQVADVPWDLKWSGGVAVVHEPGLPVEYFRKSFMRERDRSRLQEMMKMERYQVFQLSPAGSREFGQVAAGLRTRPGSNLANTRFIIMRNPETSPIPVQQIPYRPGGHVMYPDGFFVSQGKMRSWTSQNGTVEHVLGGDTNVLHFRTSEQAARYADLLDTYRFHLNSGMGINRRRQWIRDNMPALTFREVESWFAEGGPLDLTAPIVARRIDQTTDDVANYSRHFPGYTREVNDPTNLYNDNPALLFAEQRGESIDTIKEFGSTQNPLFQRQTAELMSPRDTLDRAARMVLNKSSMDDAKIKAAESFLQRYEAILELDETTAAFPLRALFEAPFKQDTAHKALLAEAKAFRRATKQFFNTPNLSQQVWDSFRYTMADQIFARMGQRALDRTSEWSIMKAQNPVQALRSAAFDLTLGLFNPIQAFLQAQTLTHILSVAGPQHGTQALAFVNYSRLARKADPNTAHELGKRMGDMFGFNQQELGEAFLAMRRTNWDYIGREVTTLGDVSDSAIFSGGKVQRAREVARLFFKFGERVNRTAAWGVAYKEWKAQNPTRRLVADSDVQQVLDRADFLAVRMTRASNAAWNDGLASVPTQFLSYQARLAEIYLTPKWTGRTNARYQLTNAEWARGLAGHSMMYGLPIGLFGTTLGFAWEVPEEIKTELMEQGVDMDANKFTQLLEGGVFNMLSSYMTGDDGLALSERWGPGGVSFFKDLMQGDVNKEFFDVLIGPSGKMLGDLIQTLPPAVMSFAHIFSDDPARFHVTKDRVLELARNIRSVKVGNDVYNAIFLNKIISKSGINLDDIDGWTGTFAALTGSVPQTVQDTYRAMDINKALKEHQKEWEREVVKYTKMAMQAEDLDTKAALQQKANDAWLMGGFQPYQARRIMKRIAESHGNLVDHHMRTMRRKSPELLELYMKKMMRREERNQ